MNRVRITNDLLTSPGTFAKLFCMMTEDQIKQQRAMILFDRAFRHQMQGELQHAAHLYQQSIEAHPTAEAYTFLGWTYNMMGRLEEAIDMCYHAITVDPTLGNPYNDIGVYLIEQERWEEAIAWFEKAIAAPRYEVRQFPYMNLGRVYEHLGRYRTALQCYDSALKLDPLYLPATWAKTALLGKMN